MKYRFIVEGMTCSVCSSAVEKVTLRVEGVRQAAVNLSAKTLYCECEKKTNPEDIIKKIEAAGFSATLLGESAPQKTENEERRTLCRLFVSVAFLLPLMYLSMGEMLSLPLPAFLSVKHAPLNAALFQFFLCLCVLILNRVFFVRGVAAVRRKSANMDTLVSLGSLAAVLYSVYSTVLYCLSPESGLGVLYFDGAAMILTLVTLGKHLEQRAKQKTSGALTALQSLCVERICVLRGEQEVEVTAQEVAAGDLVVIRPGERLAVDGVVERGQSSLDTSAVTGESLPRDVTQGDAVVSGSINLVGVLYVRASRSAGESTLSQMIALVEEAGVSRAPVARLADRVAAVFVPSVCAIALLTVLLWLLFGFAAEQAIGFGISVLVVSCPCALGLATPVAITAALGRCASRGVLVREAAVFERFDCDTFVFDKTGTLTVGAPSVTDVFALCDREEFLTLAASVEQESEHPLGRAVCRFAEVARKEVQDFRAVFGKGVRARLDGEVLLGGSAAFLKENGVDTALLEEQTQSARDRGKTVLYFSLGARLLGALALSDSKKDGAPVAVDRLKEVGREVVMLTGDHASAARAIATECHIDTVLSEVLPQNKEAEIRRLQKAGQRVCMVGDGVNDAAALSAADVAISVGSGTDLAQNCADIILLSGDLKQIPSLFVYARRVRRIVKENLFWAFFYNVLMIPLAAGALYVPFGLVLNPMIASACMSLSSLFVVTNALRLYRGKENL
ncbi:MAG: cadmium-translocating P-type ATPase [Clostridia bacterium]|nr:cadmium-translocating P-type ATPase [Clostridia bacterium]